MMLMSISLSLHDLSQQDFIHMHTLPIYTCHIPHILWKNPQAYTIQHSVQQGRSIKVKSMPIFLELHDKSMRFKSTLPKSSPHTKRIVSYSPMYHINTVFHTLHDTSQQVYKSQSLFSGMHLASNISISNNMIFLFQKCDTISQDHTWLAK